MAGEPGTPHHMFVAPVTLKLLNYFVMQGSKEQMVNETIEELDYYLKTALQHHFLLYQLKVLALYILPT